MRNSPSIWLCRATCQTPLLGAGLSQGTVLPTVGKQGPGDIHNRPSVQQIRLYEYTDSDVDDRWYTQLKFVSGNKRIIERVKIVAGHLAKAIVHKFKEKNRCRLCVGLTHQSQHPAPNQLYRKQPLKPDSFHADSFHPSEIRIRHFLSAWAIPALVHVRLRRTRWGGRLG